MRTGRPFLDRRAEAADRELLLIEHPAGGQGAEGHRPRLARLDAGLAGAFNRVFREYRDMLGRFGQVLMDGGTSRCPPRGAAP